MSSPVLKPFLSTDFAADTKRSSEGLEVLLFLSAFATSLVARVFAIPDHQVCVLGGYRNAFRGSEILSPMLRLGSQAIPRFLDLISPHYFKIRLLQKYQLNASREDLQFADVSSDICQFLPRKYPAVQPIGLGYATIDFSKTYHQTVILSRKTSEPPYSMYIMTWPAGSESSPTALVLSDSSDSKISSARLLSRVEKSTREKHSLKKCVQIPDNKDSF